MDGEIEYEVPELVREVGLMKRLAEPFIEPSSLPVFDGLVDQLEQLKVRKDPLTVEINPRWPIRTISCDGGYERDNGGEYESLFGEIVFNWEFHPIGSVNKKPKARRRVAVRGKASTVARLHIRDEQTVINIASWRMEFGDAASPGSYFHSQIPDTLLDHAKVDPNGPSEPAMWPPWLAVPRLPIPAFTPMLALEFLLAEIFQDAWPAHLQSGVYEANEWRSLQSHRLVKYFEWQAANARRSGEGSPLLAMKSARPSAGLFLVS